MNKKKKTYSNWVKSNAGKNRNNRRNKRTGKFTKKNQKQKSGINFHVPQNLGFDQSQFVVKKVKKREKKIETKDIVEENSTNNPVEKKNEVAWGERENGDDAVLGLFDEDDFNLLEDENTEHENKPKEKKEEPKKEIYEPVRNIKRNIKPFGTNNQSNQGGYRGNRREGRFNNQRNTARMTQMSKKGSDLDEIEMYFAMKGKGVHTFEPGSQPKKEPKKEEPKEEKKEEVKEEKEKEEVKEEKK